MKFTFICVSVSVAADILAVNDSVVILHSPRQIAFDRQFNTYLQTLKMVCVKYLSSLGIWLSLPGQALFKQIVMF